MHQITNNMIFYYFMSIFMTSHVKVHPSGEYEHNSTLVLDVIINWGDKALVIKE